MVRSIITLNNTNYLGNNQFSLRLPSVCSFDKDTKISLYSFTMYNSFYNISASQYQNTQITFTWFDGTVYSWNIPDGYYSISDLNLWLQQQFLINNLYVTNATNSQNIFFVAFKTNATLYKNEIDTNYMPSATNSTLFGYSKPTSAIWNFPSINTCVSITINNNLKSFFGMTTQTSFGIISPVQNMQYVSQICPIVSPVFSIFISCNLILTKFSQVGNIFCQIPINAEYGKLITYNSQIDTGVNVQSGMYNSINIGLWDQLYNPLQFIDNELVLMLVIDHN